MWAHIFEGTAVAIAIMAVVFVGIVLYAITQWMNSGSH